MLPDERVEAHEQLRLLNALAAAIGASPTVDDAFAATLRIFCEAGDWVVAQVWLPDLDRGLLTCSSVWYQRHAGFDTFREASQRITFRRGEPFLGAVWADAQTRWADDMDVNHVKFKRSSAAAASGLKGILAVPVSSNGEVTAVLEFLTRDQDELRADLRSLINAAAAHLSLLIAQKAAEAELRRSEAMFRAVAHTANDCIVSIDINGRITYVNPQGSQLFGYEDGDLLGAPVTNLIPERLRDSHLAGFARYLATGDGNLVGRTALVPGRRLDGSEVIIELSLARWEAEETSYFTAIIRDVSERQRMQEELERALEQQQEAAERLQALDQMKNTFLDALSHDLRGPLAAFRATTTLVKRDADQPLLTTDQRRSYLTQMTDALDKMRRLLDDLLDMERLDAGEIPLQLASVNVADLVRRTVEEHRGAFGARAIELDLRPAMAKVDSGKVERIVENLLLNACRHTPMDTQVRVSVNRQNGNVVICVDDTGPGVPEHLRSTIFERFRQKPGSSAAGLGMGLSLVARLATMHGGRAWVEQRSGGGAAFRVSLPATGSTTDVQVPGG